MELVFVYLKRHSFVPFGCTATCNSAVGEFCAVFLRLGCRIFEIAERCGGYPPVERFSNAPNIPLSKEMQGEYTFRT